MLVLTRKLGEQVLINDHIRISIHRIDNTRVKIGIDAPSDVPILRDELVFEATAPEDLNESDLPADNSDAGLLCAG